MKKLISIKIKEDVTDSRMSISEALALLNTAFKNRNAKQTEFLATQIIALSPGTLSAYYPLFELFKIQQRFEELNVLTKQALLHHPKDGLCHYHQAIALRFLREPIAASKAMETAVQICPKKYEWTNLLGIMHKENGQIFQANKCFSECINKNSSFIAPYWHRSDISNELSFDEEKFLIQNIDNGMNDNDKVYAAYTLFRHFHQQKKYERAFEHLSLGAKIKKSQFSYNHLHEIEEHRAISQVFNRSSITPTDQLPDIESSDSPIFICGLPRSGTTLAEQIISAHPLVNGGDELFELARATQSVLTPKLAKLGFPYWAPELKSQQWLEIGKRYLTFTKAINTQRYFTDKMPLNYKAVGLIRQALPEAKIVYCHRHPMDVLWGCYKQLFGQGNHFTYDLSELTEMIIAHHHLMKHWCSLYPDHIFTLDYETLIDNQRDTTEKLLDFLSLEWNEQCLAFHKNDRTVHTMSNIQIRQKLSSGNIGQWRQYQEHLLPYYERLIQAQVISE